MKKWKLYPVWKEGRADRFGEGVSMQDVADELAGLWDADGTFSSLNSPMSSSSSGTLTLDHLAQAMGMSLGGGTG